MKNLSIALNTENYIKSGIQNARFQQALKFLAILDEGGGFREEWLINVIISYKVKNQPGWAGISSKAGHVVGLGLLLIEEIS